jgi:hypothetical protein
MHKEICVKTGYSIIQDHGPAAFHLAIDFSGWRRLYYIEKPEKNKSGKGASKAKGDKDHGDEEPHDFVDHDPGAVFPTQNDFCPFSNPRSEEKKGRRAQQINPRRKGREDKIEKDACEGSDSTRGNWEKTKITCRSHKDYKFVQDACLSSGPEFPKKTGMLPGFAQNRRLRKKFTCSAVPLEPIGSFLYRCRVLRKYFFLLRFCERRSRIMGELFILQPSWTTFYRICKI